MSSYTPIGCPAAHRPTAAILTLGCKVNQYESQAIAEALTDAGLDLLAPTEVCDVYIINTCTVTSESDRKARQAIRRLVTRNPEAFVVVTGCSAQADPARVAAIRGVDAVIGNRNKLAVVDAVRTLLESGCKASGPAVDVPPLAGSDFEPMTITRFDRTRAYVKIQDGCDSHCAYCAIPAARGPVRSKPRADVVREVTDLVAGGCREVVLTGIETGSWGRDLPDASDGGLATLLSEIDRIPGVGRIRLGSLDPTVITPSFVETVASLRSVAPHFHLSMQSGCAATLARMRRKYNPRQAEAAMARLRTAIPNVQFTTDMIVGFPGETEEEFAESVAFARRAAFLHIHVFPYSRRNGTPAATMPDQVPEPVKHERVKVLSAVSSETAAAILDGVLESYRTTGVPLRVLFESRDGGMMSGHTPDFLEVQVETACDLCGQEADVYLLRREGECLVGSLTAPLDGTSN